ncbi:thiamine biosynthetic bifunctional enzyme, partial [Coemansia sp. RSA 2703]
MKPIFDLTLCLIADSSMVPRGSTLTDVVSQAIQGGATAVLLHDKISSTRAFVELARSVHQVTQRNGVSLLISDRIDVALAAGAEGVHMGHDGMPLTEARSILGNDKIIGVSVGSAKQAQDAVAGGADYLGIGPCFVTTEDAHNEEPCGARGVRDIWQAALLAKDTTVKAVAMGGIGVDNAAHVFNYSRAQGRPLDGVAVGAAVMSADSPCAAAEQLVAQLRYASGTLWPALSRSPGDSPAAIVSAIAAVFSSARSSEVRPLVPHITNRVSATDCANACLALGASPIMEALADEQASLLAHAGALLINIGTLSLAAIAGMHAAVKAAGVHRTPVVLDPVAAGATPLRRAL